MTPTAHEKHFEGATLAYLKAGTGPSLVIVHGVGGHKEDWIEVVTALADRRTIYAVDMLGFGGSSRDAQDLSMPAQARAIKSLLESENVTRTEIIGNSVGGWVASTFAATYPAVVSKLVVVDPAGFAKMFEGEMPVNLFPDDLDQMKKLLSFVLHSDFAHTEKFAAEAFASFQAHGEKSIVPRLFPALLGSPKLEDVMPKISCPTLVMWGKEDKLFPVALAPSIVSLVPGARLVTIAGASHFPQIDQPDAFISAVRDFLA